MRCTNCGFENADNATHCIKCNMVLDTSAIKQAAPATRKEAPFAGTIADNQFDHPPAPLINCPHPDCGYPYSSELKVCPRCRRPAGAAKPFNRTIDPYRIKTPEEEKSPPSCYLLPVAKAGEMSEEQPKRLAFTYAQQSIVLNRDTLDPGNTSITGKAQAELTYQDGAWRLKDSSELQTTFLQVSEDTILKEGDIILFGDRKFIFSLSNQERHPGR